MSITPDVYSVFCDGRPIERGLTKPHAYEVADRLAREQNRKNASDKRRNPEWEVRLDKHLVETDDQLYKWAKQGGS